MELDKILEKLQELFGTYQIERVETFLEEHIEQAFAVGDIGTVITLMNEMIGYLRDTGKNDKALYYCDRVLALMKQEGLEGSIPYATTLLNVANAYRAAGRLQESLVQYQTVLMLYEEELRRMICFMPVFLTI